jgi:predicted nucleic acid-binding protein
VNGKRLVIDASVALKWRLRDEEATSQADALLDDFLAGKLELLTPTLFDYEIANALRVAVTRQRLSEQDAAAALTDFAQYTIVRYAFTGLASRTFHRDASKGAACFSWQRNWRLACQGQQVFH